MLTNMAKSIKKLAKILNRGLIGNIQKRHGRLMSENEYTTSRVGQKAWKVEEEGILIRYIFDTRLNLKGIRNHQDINLIENISENEFSECAEVLKRNNQSCHFHWMRVIVPALKTHFLFPLERLSAYFCIVFPSLLRYPNYFVSHHKSQVFNQSYTEEFTGKNVN